MRAQQSALLDSGDRVMVLTFSISYFQKKTGLTLPLAPQRLKLKQLVEYLEVMLDPKRLEVKPI